MKSHNRLLIGFGIAIALLVIVAVALVLSTGQQQPALLPQDTPEGTVQRYLMAIQNKDFNAAYDFLSAADTQDNPKPFTRDMWISQGRGMQDLSWKANLGKVSVTGDRAVVEVSIHTFRSGGPFDDNTNSHNVTFYLEKQDGKWLITTPRELYILYY